MHGQPPTAAGGLAERYLLLGLRLGRHVDGLVDSYYGPPELREQADTGEPVGAPELADEAGALLDALPDAGLHDGQRERWLRAQLVGLETVARKLAGEDIPYVDEVERCYGVRLERIPEQRFEAAHRELDAALPRGDGGLDARYQAWVKPLEVPAETLGPLVRAITAELRERTRERIGLPDGEDTEIQLVEHEPWAAFNYYLGGLRSRVVFNTDIPIHAHMVAPVTAHELYPGHHTEHATKETLLVRDRGRVELTATFIGTPESMVSEGIAEVAFDVLLGADAPAFGARHAAAFGIEYDPEVARRVVDARRALAEVSVNTALLLHEDGASEDEAAAYLSRWALSDPVRARKGVAFMTDPTWRAYVACYSQGEKLAQGYVGDDVGRFRRLLGEQLTPADLRPAPTP